MAMDLMLAYLKLFEFLPFFLNHALECRCPTCSSHESAEQMKKTEHDVHGPCEDAL